MKYKILKNDHLDIKHPVTKKPVRLYRIFALKSFTSPAGEVVDGNIGGYIQDESNLNQNDSSWLFNSAKIFDNALLVDSSLCDNAAAFQNAILQDSIGRSYGQASGDCTVIESTFTSGTTVKCARVERSKLFGSCRLEKNAEVIDSTISDGVIVTDFAKVIRCELRDTTLVKGQSIIENCHYSGHTLINNGKYVNETRQTDLELNIEQQVLPASTTF